MTRPYINGSKKSVQEENHILYDCRKKQVPSTPCFVEKSEDNHSLVLKAHVRENSIYTPFLEGRIDLKYFPQILYTKLITILCVLVINTTKYPKHHRQLYIVRGCLHCTFIVSTLGAHLGALVKMTCDTILINDQINACLINPL